MIKMEPWKKFLFTFNFVSILDSGNPVTYLNKSWNCTCITSGGPIEPENFDRWVAGKWLYWKVVNIPSSFEIVERYFKMSFHVVFQIAIWSCDYTKFIFAGVTWFWKNCQFHRINSTCPVFFRIKYANWYLNYGRWLVPGKKNILSGSH